MEKYNFNSQWEFCKKGDESAQIIDVPHDAMIHEKRSTNASSGSAGAYFLGGIYEYKKKFRIPEEWKEKFILFCFEGVYKNSTVSINGKEVGGCAYGYSQFYVDATYDIKAGQENVITVAADNSEQPNSRWYTGSGIYRPVHMIVMDKEHININGVQISTLSYQPARIKVETKHTGGDSIEIEILDNNGVVARGQGSSLELEIQGARLWSDKSPNLYKCKVMLIKDDVVIDEMIEEFGIRLISWSPKGFLVNGEEVLLRGGCVHHDNGILGACSYPVSEERRVKILRDAGFNAIRSSHNPASVSMLEACDRLGMYVMDETWDMWYKHKSKHDYAGDFYDNYKFDIESLVARDFNHPSVIMYSIGNEVSEPASEKGQHLTKELVEYFQTLDSTRPIVGGFNLMIISQSSKGKGVYQEDGGMKDSLTKESKGMNSTVFNMISSFIGPSMNKMANSKKVDKVTSPSLDMLDIAGYNYGSGRYKKEGELHPDRIIMGSETFPQDIVKNWKMVKEYPYLIGDFMWTAWDYIGEVGLGAWAYNSDGKGFNKPYPWKLADTGAFDILGNPTGEIFLAQAAWGILEGPKIAVQPVNKQGITPAKAVWRGTNAIPSWSWKDCEGNKAIVEVYSNAKFVELFLNGNRIGKKKVKDCIARFKTKYSPGKLEALEYDAAGKELGRAGLESATGSSYINISSEEIAVEEGAIVYIDISIIGGNHVIECNADEILKVSVTGGDLLALGSANPRTKEDYTDGIYTTYYGKAQAVVKAGTNKEMVINVNGKEKKICIQKKQL